MIRRDWTETLPKSNLLDLSTNVCYDRFINRSYSFDDLSYPDDGLSYGYLSNYYNISPKNIAIGYGSCELILRIFYLYKNNSITIIGPTWQLAEMYASEIGMKIVDNGDLLYIANPNGLTGQALSRDEIINLTKKYKLAIIDEAYGDFSNCSIYDIASRLDNVIVVKTFSKTIATPGLRFGYCFSNEHIIRQIQNVRPGYVTTGQTQSAIKCLLPQIHDHVSRMIETRNYIERKYPVIFSQGNYVLFKEDPCIPVKMKKIDSYYRMALTDIDTFRHLENGYH